MRAVARAGLAALTLVVAGAAGCASRPDSQPAGFARTVSGIGYGVREIAETPFRDLNLIRRPIPAVEGRWLGGETFVSFDKAAVSLIATQGHQAKSPD